MRVLFRKSTKLGAGWAVLVSGVVGLARGQGSSSAWHWGMALPGSH